MEALLAQVRACRLCEKHLPHGVRPVLKASANAKILIIGQAPGKKVHESGIPWDDASGNRLRTWLNVDKKTFYNEEIFAIVPMGFCYPGTENGGDLPPRPECAPTWHKKILAHMPNIDLVLLIGAYAQAEYLGNKKEKTLTSTVQKWQEYGPRFLPLPHPSPRNVRWFKKNPWFEEQVIPHLQQRVKPYL